MADKGEGIADDYSSGKRKHDGDDKSANRTGKKLNVEDSAFEIDKSKSSDDDVLMSDVLMDGGVASESGGGGGGWNTGGQSTAERSSLAPFPAAGTSLQPESSSANSFGSTDNDASEDGGGSAWETKTTQDQDTAMEPEKWSAEVKGDESYTFTVGRAFLHITEVALGESKDGEEVRDLDVWLKTSYGKNEVLRTLSSESPEPEAAPLVIYPGEGIELTHGWTGGIVHIRGYIEKCRGLEHYNATVLGDSVGMPKASLEDIALETEEKTASSTPTLEDCMELVEGYPGFEDGSSGYTRALYLFYSDESTRVQFMIPSTLSEKMAFLKTVMSNKTN